MIRRLSWLAIAAGLALTGGCGDDGGGTTPTDSGTSTPCPRTSPDREGMMGACCYRVRNEGARLDAPEMRLAELKVTAPTSLSNTLVRSLLKSALDDERFNWIFRSAVTGGDIAIETGYGERNADATFSFASGTAPSPGDANRWNPVTLTGTIADEVVMTGALDGAMTVPVFDDDGVTLTAEFPLRGLALTSVTLTEDRSCIGSRNSVQYTTDSGLLEAYITVEEAKTVPIVVGSTLDTTLCMFVAGRSSEEGTCDDTPQADWPVPPDSMCDTSGCSMGGCDASDCNAWHLTSEFAAHGVEITD